jgi:hypothetical protein
MSEGKPPVLPFGRRHVLRACLALSLVAIGCWLWGESQRGWTTAKLERLIRSELQPGCDRVDVEAWLDRHGIQRFGSRNPWTIEDSMVIWDS